MIYEIAEKFKSLQGEGLYAGTPMAFIRLVGCSVGKRVCHACDTDFDKTLPWRGGGTFSEEDLFLWAGVYNHICLTGGEPNDRDLRPIFQYALDHEGAGRSWTIHVETSGTRAMEFDGRQAKIAWICISPKPGFIEEEVLAADEVKVIVPGLGSGPGWPQLEDALRWADAGKLVFLQPRNGKFDIDNQNLRYVQDLLIDHPNLRLSLQAHKLLKVQ